MTPTQTVTVADADDAEDWGYVQAYLAAAQRALPAGGTEAVDEVYVLLSNLIVRVLAIRATPTPAVARTMAEAVSAQDAALAARRRRVRRP